MTLKSTSDGHARKKYPNFVLLKAIFKNQKYKFEFEFYVINENIKKKTFYIKKTNNWSLYSS
jgi:hypothetical protein